MGRGDEAVNEAGVVQHDLVLEGDELVGFLHAVDLLEQGEPEGLAVALFVALPGPVGGKLSRGGSLLYVSHGGGLLRGFSSV